MNDHDFMVIALEQARKSSIENGIPVGAVLVSDGVVVATGHNRRVQDANPIAHGEMDCIQRAGRQKSLRKMTLYTTLSPCMMCTGTVVQFKIARVVIGDAVNFSGNIPFLESCGVKVEVLNDSRCITLMKEFIEQHPSLWNEDIGEA